MTEVPNLIKEKIYSHVRADLTPSRLVVHTKIGTSISLGGLVSLFLCGQLGVGLTTLAMAVHSVVMGVGGVFGCTFVCGVLFAIVPVLTLRTISTGVQFWLLVRKEWRAIAGWNLVFGSILAYQSSRSDPLWILLLWLLAAVGSFELLARVLANRFRVEKLIELFNPKPG